MELKRLNHIPFTSKLTKPAKKHIVSSALKKVLPSNTKPDPKLAAYQQKAFEFKNGQVTSLADPKKKIAGYKGHTKTKSINITNNTTFKKMMKENVPGPSASHLASSHCKNLTRSCVPSPIRNRSREEVHPVPPLQERRPVQEPGHKKTQSLLPENYSHYNREKKRVKVIKIDRFAQMKQQQQQQQQIQNLHQEYFQNPMVAMNPVMEQDMYREYLATDKQTFGFEKLILSGICDMSQLDIYSEQTPQSNTRTNELLLSTKFNKVETKHRSTIKDLSIAGMTTHSSSREKKTTAAINGFSENLDLIELIEWSSETERFGGLKSPLHAHNVIFEETKPSTEKANIKQRPPTSKQQKPSVTPFDFRNEVMGRCGKEKMRFMKEIQKRDQSL